MAQEKAKGTLKLPTIIGYGAAGMFAIGIQVNFVAYILLAFLTEVAGFPTVVAASINTIANLVKLVAMILSGIIIDATYLKSGKYRTWVLIAGVFALLTTGTMFMKFNMNQTLYVVVFLVIFFVNQLAYSIAWTGGRALVGPMSKTSADGIALTSAAQIGSSAAGIVYGLINASLLAAFAATASPYCGTGYVYGAIFLVGCIAMFLLTKKYDVPAAVQPAAANGAKAPKIGLLEMLKSLKGQGLIFFIGTTFGNIQSGFFMTLLYYFTTFVLKDPNALGLAVTFSSIGGFVGAFLAPAVCNKFSKKAVYIWAHIISAVLYVLMFLIGNQSVMFMIIRTLIGFVGTFAGVTLPALGNDLADYNEMRGQSNARAFVQSMIGASIRIGTLISGAVASFGLAAVGYVAGTAPEQHTLTGIAALMGIAPAIVCVIAAIIIAAYKVDENELDAYRKEKAAKLAAAATEEK